MYDKEKKNVLSKVTSVWKTYASYAAITKMSLKKV